MLGIFNRKNKWNQPTRTGSVYTKEIVKVQVGMKNEDSGKVINKISDIGCMDPIDNTPIYKNVTKFYRMDRFVWTHKTKPNKKKYKKYYYDITEEEYLKNKK